MRWRDLAWGAAVVLTGLAPGNVGAAPNDARGATPGYTTTAVSFPAYAASAGRDELPATLLRPDGAGPFAAIVFLHGCSGLGSSSSGSPRRWAEVLVQAGFMVLIPDSFTPRGAPDGVCLSSVTSRLSRNALRAVSHDSRARDAHAAKAYLRTRGDVNATRIGVMGASHGGSSTLAALVDDGLASDGLPSTELDGGFAAAVALYPRCGRKLGEWNVVRQSRTRGPVTGYSGVYRPRAPLLILIGDADDWTPAEHCQELAARSLAAAQPVAIKVYRGAHHSFDGDRARFFNPNRNNINMADGKGATTGGNRDAWADSIQATTAFFTAHLAPR